MLTVCDRTRHRLPGRYDENQINDLRERLARDMDSPLMMSIIQRRCVACKQAIDGPQRIVLTQNGPALICQPCYDT